MSYSVEIKKSLFEPFPKKNKLIQAELAGIIISGARISFNNDQIDFVIKTENASFARYTYRLMEKCFNIKGEINFTRSERFYKHRTYILTYKNAQKILDRLGVIKKVNYGYISPILNSIFFKSKSQKIAFIKGIFIHCGSISSPDKRYHLEIDAPNEAVTECCSELLDKFGIKGHFIESKNHSVFYLKDSKMISKFLGLIGASKAMFDYEGKKIVRQMRGDINRRVNCEMANINKTAKAASEQIEAIEFLSEHDAIENLPDDLKQAALLRSEHPDDSITELGKRTDPVISRSTLYRRLKRIVELAESLKNDEERKAKI